MKQHSNIYKHPPHVEGETDAEITNQSYMIYA